MFVETDNKSFHNNIIDEINIKSYTIKSTDFESRVLQKIIFRIGEVLKSINKNNLTFDKVSYVFVN